MEFMVDCAVKLNHRVAGGVSHRSMRVLKYRGSAFEEDESPFAIGDHGLEVAGARGIGVRDLAVTHEKLSSGVARLDTMLEGGYYRGASVLITGFPGTAKSTLSGAFAESACARGERTLFVSFDSDAGEVIRNLSSVNIRLKKYVEKGVLLTKSARGTAASAEIRLMRIKSWASDHKARCIVIDPISALSKGGNEEMAHGVGERLIDWTKSNGITLVCTSLLDGVSASQMEGTPMQISTIADTWIHLNYLVNGGERNRGLSIIKSRGTGHSNQVRELILSRSGVTLADAYMAGGEVLMGTLRWEKEREERRAQEAARSAALKRRVMVEREEAEIAARIESLKRELELKRSESEILAREAASSEAELALTEKRLKGLRKADVGTATRK